MVVIILEDTPDMTDDMQDEERRLVAINTRLVYCFWYIVYLNLSTMVLIFFSKPSTLLSFAEVPYFPGVESKRGQ